LIRNIHYFSNIFILLNLNIKINIFQLILSDLSHTGTAAMVIAARVKKKYDPNYESKIVI